MWLCKWKCPFRIIKFPLSYCYTYSYCISPRCVTITGVVGSILISFIGQCYIVICSLAVWLHDWIKNSKGALRRRKWYHIQLTIASNRSCSCMLKIPQFTGLTEGCWCGWGAGFLWECKDGLPGPKTSYNPGNKCTVLYFLYPTG